MTGTVGFERGGSARRSPRRADLPRGAGLALVASLVAACRGGPRVDADGARPAAVTASALSATPPVGVPELRVPRIDAGQAPRVDGRLDDPAWRAAADTGAFRDVATGAVSTAVDVGGSALLLWDDEALYVGASIADRDVEGGFPAGAVDPHLWTRDTLEVMIDPDGDGDGHDYYEIQIGPQNIVFDSCFDAYNAPRGGPDGPFGHEGWSSRVESAVTVHGSLDEPGDEDEGYVVEARLPWAAFTRARRAPPAPGDRWRVNLYAMENNGGVAWSPILGQGNFHRASRFGRLIFSGASAGGAGAAAAARASAAVASAGALAPAPPVATPTAHGR